MKNLMVKNGDLSMISPSMYNKNILVLGRAIISDISILEQHDIDLFVTRGDNHNSSRIHKIETKFNIEDLSGFLAVGEINMNDLPWAVDLVVSDVAPTFIPPVLDRGNLNYEEWLSLVKKRNTRQLLVTELKSKAWFYSSPDHSYNNHFGDIMFHGLRQGAIFELESL